MRFEKAGFCRSVVTSSLRRSQITNHQSLFVTLKQDLKSAQHALLVVADDTPLSLTEMNCRFCFLGVPKSVGTDLSCFSWLFHHVCARHEATGMRRRPPSVRGQSRTYSEPRPFGASTIRCLDHSEPRHSLGLKDAPPRLAQKSFCVTQPARYFTSSYFGASPLMTRSHAAAKRSPSGRCGRIRRSARAFLFD